MMRNPVFESSMRRRMRSFRAPMLLTLYMLFLLIVSSGALFTLQYKEVSLSNLRSGLEAYVYISVLQFILILLVSPALTTGTIAGERERQTLDLLLCTRVGSVRIILGKMFSSVCFLTLLIFSSLPAMAVTSFFGGVSLADMFIMLLFLVVTALACSSIGIFCSAVFKRTVTATVVAYLAIFVLGVGTVVFPLIFRFGMLSNLQDLVNNASGSIAGVSATSFFGRLVGIPKAFFLNPAIGVLSLLVAQTGVLERTLNSFFGYYGNQLFSFLEYANHFAIINICALAACSGVLTGFAALFIKPAGRRSAKR